MNGVDGSREEAKPSSKRSRWDKSIKEDADGKAEKRMKPTDASINDNSENGPTKSSISSKQSPSNPNADASKSSSNEQSKATKTPSLSLDALAKAKRALQMQKELNEKLKKLPQLKSSVSAATSSATPVVKTKEVSAQPSTPMAIPSAPSIPTSVSDTLPSVVLNAVPGVVPGLVPGVIPGAIPSVIPGGVPGVIPNLESILTAQQMAVRLGLNPVASNLSPFLGVGGIGGLAGATIGSIPGLQVADSLAKLPSQQDTPAPVKPAKAPVLRLDAQGREIDEEGNVIERGKIGPVSTLKVNINKKKKDEFKILHPELEPEPMENPFYDPRMGINRSKLVRQRRMSFNFIEEGKFVKEAELQRLKKQFGEASIKGMKAQAEAKEEESEAINPNLIEVGERAPSVSAPKPKPKPPIPDVEWWDAAILVGGKYTEAFPMQVKSAKITIYVEHPIQMEPPAEITLPPPQPLKLTKKERKKLRTQKRLAREKERQEMIRQGLLEPPKPKIKMSNLMKVLVNEAVQDPTKMEKQVRKEAEEREQAHADRNLARKLTPAERREKKERKLFEDGGLCASAGETFVHAYRVDDLSNPQNRFKVDINAQENRLTGCVAITSSMNLVIVEGGSKSIKRYSKLMLRRINWNASLDKGDEDEDMGDDDGKKGNKCILVWSGCISAPNFEKFSIQRFGSASMAKKFLADHHCEHFWDLAESYSPEA